MLTFIKRLITQFRPRPKPFTSDIIVGYQCTNCDMTPELFEAFERLFRLLIEQNKKAKSEANTSEPTATDPNDLH
ncbi:hypothetical protein VI06_21600 [Aquitalea magnusonii]|nr:hypothetical protein VI06_21600 [Aquitalea magnusonii]